MDNSVQNTPHAILFKGESRISSLDIANGLQQDHKVWFNNILIKYQSDFEQAGTLYFKNTKSKGRKTRYALLNEDQVYIALTFARNTSTIRQMKVNLVLAFKQAREQGNTETEYLIFYHEMHDNIKGMVAHQGKEDKESLFHMNYNKLINKAFDIPSGCRKDLTPQQRVWVSCANSLVMNLVEACDKQGMPYSEIHQLAKKRLANYAESVKTPALGGK